MICSPDGSEKPCAKKTDFLRGLHENILVGQSIPAGTGIISLTQSSEKTQESEDSSL